MESGNGVPDSKKCIEYLRNGEFQKSIECFDRVLARDPQNPKIWNNKGSALSTAGQYREAVVCFDRAIELNPNNAKVWYNKATTLLKIGNLKEALVSFEKTISLDPQDVRALYKKGEILLKQEEFMDALPCFDKILSRFPKSQRVIVARNQALNGISAISAPSSAGEMGSGQPPASSQNPSDNQPIDSEIEKVFGEDLSAGTLVPKPEEQPAIVRPAKAVTFTIVLSETESLEDMESAEPAEKKKF